MFNCQFSNSYMGHFGRLVQNCRNSSALAMELLQSFTKPLTWVEPTHTDYRHSSGKHPCGVGLSLINFNVKPHGLSLINFNVKPHGQKDLKISVWQFIESCHGKLMTSTKVFMGPQDTCRSDLISPQDQPFMEQQKDWRSHGKMTRLHLW